MSNFLSFDELKKQVKNGTIDTVIVAFPDMQGRLMGKRFHAEFFLESGGGDTHCCNYLIATDIEMNTVPGYDSTSWKTGYGDYVMKPDLSTLRPVSWLEGTAMVLCDLFEEHTHQPISHAPREILKTPLVRLKKMGFQAAMASELEFFVFEQNFETAHKQNYQNIEPVSPYNEDYHIFQTTKEEGLMRKIRNELRKSGVPVENTKGEASAGQEEINLRYSDAFKMADTHTVVKNAIKEIAWLNDKAVTFMAKWNSAVAGSSGHIHQSLQNLKGKPVFYDSKEPHGMSKIMKNYLAGLLAHSSEITFFLAPYINSYKRFTAETFAPTKAVWSIDNRTAGYRIVAPGTQGVRIECRIGGSDLNPYLAYAAQIAAGISGIENNLELEEVFAGDAYQKETLRTIPINLRAAIEALKKSKMLKHAFGEEVIKHYVRCAEWEQEDFDSKVTDYELKRGFERF